MIATRGIIFIFVFPLYVPFAFLHLIHLDVLEDCANESASCKVPDGTT